MKIKEIIIVSFCLFTLFSYSQKKTTKTVIKEKPKTKIEKVFGVGLLFKSEKFEFGVIKQFSGESINLEYTNNGTEPLTIYSISSSCACLTVSFSKEPVLSGKSSIITVKHNTEKIGKFQKTLIINSNATNQNSRIIIITGEVVDSKVDDNGLANLANERKSYLKNEENKIVEKNKIREKLLKTKLVIDERDGKSYKLEIFNNKLWFIEDLRYEGKEHTTSNYSQFKDKGLFYKNTNLYSNELCPKGFRFPKKEEFNLLPDSYFINYSDFKGRINFNGSGFGDERKQQSIANRDNKSSEYLTFESGEDDSQVIRRYAYIFLNTYDYNLKDYIYKRISYEKVYEINYFNCRCIEE